MDRLRRDSIAWDAEWVDGGALPSPGKVSSTARLRGEPAHAEAEPHPLAAPSHGVPAVQMYGGATQVDDAFAMHTIAREGVAGPPQQLPHREAIQRSFGHHDVGGVRAHVGGPAADATATLGAPAYATGGDVAFGSSPDLRQAAHEAAHVVQQAKGVHFDGGDGDASDPTERHADAVADTVARGGSAESLLDAGPGGGGGGGTTGVGTDLEQFALHFNQEFRAQLHVFAEGDAATEPAAERGDDIASSPDLSGASGPPVSAERLGRLFTATQRTKLETYISGGHEIPERLFNGDDIGTATAQQRILMAGHILANGHYSPGGFEQSVHARMCGHWVNLVNHYAGCSTSLGAGVREEFDHEGHLSMTVAESPTGDPTRASRDSLGAGEGIGGRTDAPEERNADFILSGLEWDHFGTVQSGDWLWVYNDCGPGGGNHSVIFSRWLTGEQRSPSGNRYRRALTMSQTSPDAGGVEEPRLLGERFETVERGHVTPIVHVERVDPTTRPLQTAEDLIAVLGSGTEAADNARFIQQHTRGASGTFNWQALTEHIQRENETKIAAIAERMTEHQRTAFREVNRGGSGGDDPELTGEALVPRLVRLNERLTALAANATALGEATERNVATARGRREERAEGTAERREALEARIAALEETIAAANERLAPLTAAYDEFESDSEALHALRHERGEKRARRTELNTLLRDRSLGEEDRTAFATELGQVQARLDEISNLLEPLEDQEGDRDYRRRRTDARRAENRCEADIRQATNRVVPLQHDLARLIGSAGYVTAHGTVAGDRFNGRGEARRLTGLLANLQPQPNWRSLMMSGGGTGGAPPETADP
ncbi:MAG TPA: DUF4157 domain-containing protein [Kofleriaceae bacterium]|nr:DUF4157 domain-containing protein [Kofleriaceae bacterium]